ncbi:MAG: type II secretion system secretin GspD [Gammaproteobacteria bacterium]|nr:type II secretion system secretin GspD [Gammaproteobacteria bacterium]
MIKQIKTIVTLLLLLSVATTTYANQVTLKFSDADIRAVIESVSQITGKNFIVDPRVKGKVTVISKKSLNKEEVYSVFLSVLQVHGYSTIPSENAIKIVPDATAKQNATPFVLSARSEKDDQLVTRVVSIENVNAAQLVPILRPLIAQQGHLAAYVGTNVLIISDRNSNITRIIKIIRSIDQASESEIELIPLKHAFASDIVRLLNNLNGANAAKGIAGQEIVKLSFDDRTNSIIMSGERAARVRYRSIIKSLDTPINKMGDTHVVYLKYADATKVAKLLSSVGKELVKNQDGAAVKSKKTNLSLNIQADEDSNALVITAPSRVFQSLRSVIQQLDIIRAQVHIEAIIAEVSIDTSNELGVQWLIDGSPKNNPVLASSFAGSGSSISSIASGAVGDGLTLGLGKASDAGTSFVALIRALSGDAESNLLSTPSIVTLDNQEAEIVVGKNVPFVTGEYSNTGSSTGSIANPFRTIERQDVGVSLKVKPQINEGQAITLEIEQEVSTISGSSTGAVDLVTNKRSINTVVRLEDGELLILGGLIDDTFIDTEQKVPVLGDIPLLGALFRSSKTQKVKRNLLVFIKATILKDSKSSRDLSQRKYNFMRETQLEAYKENTLQPVLDDLMVNDPLPIN